ncbi:MAG: Acyl-CoA thioester hydrolase YbgC [Rhodothermaeota bacterium MED-G12]|nr:MAG: Acyl-CoA thioester hydrolase YbgC [Rhodothermaeota bacterium MED-G12]
MVPKQYTPDYFPHWTEVSVRFNDMDSLSHVNNALFNSYFEEARIQVLQEIPEWIEDLARKRSFVLRKSTIEYLAPILYPDTLLIGSGLLRVDAARVYALQAVYSSNTNRLCSTAETMGVWFDLQAQRPTRIPASDVLSNYLLSSNPS